MSTYTPINLILVLSLVYAFGGTAINIWVKKRVNSLQRVTLLIYCCKKKVLLAKFVGQSKRGISSVQKKPEI